MNERFWLSCQAVLEMDRLRRFFALPYFRHGLNQILVQISTLISGILVIRALTKNEYASYSLAVAALALLTYLIESGPSSLLLKNLHSDRSASEVPNSNLLVEQFKQRTLLGVYLGIAGTVYLWINLGNIHVTEARSQTICFLLLANFVCVIPSGLIMISARFSKQLSTVRTASLMSSSFRLIATSIIVFLHIGSAEILLVVNFGTSVVLMTFLAMKTRTLNTLSHRMIFSSTSWKINNFLKTFPVALMMIAGEQYFTFFTASKGTAEIVAESSALSKFGFAFVVVNSLYNDITIPAIARVEHAKARISALKALSLYGAISASITVCVWGLSPTLIKILGHRYTGLEWEMTLFCSGIGLAYFTQTFDQINKARHWTRGGFIYLPTMVTWAVVGTNLVHAERILDCAVFFATMPIPMLITQIVRFAWGAKSLA